MTATMLLSRSLSRSLFTLPSAAGPRHASTASSVLRAAMPDLKFATHKEAYAYSIEKPDEFWRRVGESQLKWRQDFFQAMDCDMRKAQFHWYKGGKLNAAENCVDRHAEADPNRVALIWEKDEPGQQEYVTYGQLRCLVNRVANALVRHGVTRGDVVALYMPPSPLAVATMLAAAKIGAMHTVIFAGFSAESIASRIQDSKACVLVTANESVRGGKRISLLSTAVAAVAKCPSIKTVLVSRRTDAETKLEKNMTWLEDAIRLESDEFHPVPMASEDPLFLLYTSGSTGKPKGLVHSTAGYLVYAGFTHQTVFNYSAGDVFGCVADIGWITGHTYVVYGPLVNGGTTVLFESTPTHPDPGRYWETVQRLGINQFYCAPTAIRLLLKYDEGEFVAEYDRSSLKVLGSVGEPINHEAWEWYHKAVGDGRCDLVDTWWQTETGGVCIAPRPSEDGDEIVPAKAMRPHFGIRPVLLDEKGQEVSGNDVNGALCLATPWPGLAMTVFGDHQRYIDTYFSTYPGYYFTGDGAHRDDKGYVQITGRMDDVINVTGHRLGTAEVEDALNEHADVAESAVVGYPHSVKGEGVYAFVTLKMTLEGGGDQQILTKELRDLVRTKIAAFAAPDHIQFCSNLPKTRSGKIMRRILRKVAAGNFKDLGDVSTLAEPEVVDEIINNHINITKQ